VFPLTLSFLQIATLLTGAVIAGEALTLTVGTYFVANSKDPWVSRNTLFLVLDLATGLGLIYLGLAKRDIDTVTLFYVVTIINLITHGYREWEYLANIDYKFCFNKPLFVVNNLKLMGLVIISIYGLVARS
jgi:hypothetical protein